MTQEELAALEELIQDGMIHIAQGLGLIGDTLLHTDDLEGKWKEWAPEFMIPATANVNSYPEFTLACAAYAGTAAAKWWDEDWGKYHSKPFSSLYGPRGFDDMDDYICCKILGYPLESTEAGALKSAFECLSGQAWNYIRHSAVEPGTKDALYALAGAARVLFRIGSAIELKRLGYHYQAVSSRSFS